MPSAKVILLIISIAFGALFQTVTSASSQCINLNPYTKSYPAAVLLDAPKYFTADDLKNKDLKCRDVWASGTCCSTDYLTKLGQKKNQNITDAFVKLAEDLNCIERKLDEFKQASVINREIIQSPSVYFLYRLSLEEFRVNFKLGAKTCWDHMKKIRGAALCNSCAMDSSKYFKENKAVIKSTTCNTMINNCKTWFYELLQFVNGLVNLNQKVSTLNPSLQSTKIKDLIDSLRLIDAEVKGNTIIKDIEIMQSTTNVAEKIQKMNKVCDSLYVINDLTFLEKLEPLMHLGCRKADNIVEGIKVYFNTYGRFLDVLTEGVSSSEVFSSNWKPQTGLFAGDSIAIQNYNGPEMNLTLIFP